MKTTAAILVETGHPLELLDLKLPALKAGQVLVEVRTTGVCHTQLLEARGYRGADPYVPHCLGHEGVGEVLEISEGVTKVKPGDAVILSWIKGSGGDVPGTVYHESGSNRAVNAGGITTFMRHAIISENRLTPLPSDVPVREATWLGCAMPTGVGAVVNTADVKQGESVAVFGCGGVGLCAIAGAASLGASHVIAIDLLDDKLDVALQMGATHQINASTQNVAELIHALIKGGVDVAIEATGQPAVMRQALEIVRPRGGRAVVIGNARFGSEVAFDPAQFNQGKQLRGTWGGDSLPDRDYPRFAQLLASGAIDLSPLMSKPFTLEQANDALNALESGKVVRPLIDMTLQSASLEPITVAAANPC